MKIAIMGAMVEEITPLLDFFQIYEVYEKGKNKYYQTKYKNHDIIVAYSKIGKVNAALTASTLIQHFGAEILLFSGVAGAVCKDLNIGDLIIAEKLAQHDLDITAFGHPYGYVPEGAVFTYSDTSLNDIAKKVAKDKNIKLKTGVIATGDQFINDNNKKDWIQKTFDADAIEMEGASVGVVCDSLGIPFFILRAISDAANIDASFDFDSFLDSSSKQSAKFIISMLDELK